jgi:hypothetical protein
MNGRDEQEAPLRRLVDAGSTAPGGDPDWAVDLVRTAPVHQPVPGRKQRLLLRLGRRRRAPAPLALRLAVVGGLLIGGGAVASAALGYLPRWVARVYEQIAPRHAIATATAPAHHARPRNTATTVPVAAPAPAPVEGGADPIVAAPPPVAADPQPVALPPAAERPAAKVRPSRAPSAAVGRADDDPSLVMRGMRALRREGDPARARALAERYLQSYPNGRLAEEALALAIEATLAHGDAEAQILGNRYLQRYPGGPFRDLALRAAAFRPGTEDR